MTAIRTEHLTHTYSVGTPFQKVAVEDVSIAIWEGDATSTVVLGPGRFVLYFVGEAHKPSILHGEDVRLKKAVFKVRG